MATFFFFEWTPHEMMFRTKTTSCMLGRQANSRGNVFVLDTQRTLRSLVKSEPNHGSWRAAQCGLRSILSPLVMSDREEDEKWQSNDQLVLSWDWGLLQVVHR